MVSAYYASTTFSDFNVGRVIEALDPKYAKTVAEMKKLLSLLPRRAGSR